MVRIGCHFCGRKGGYRLVRLAAKYGPDIGLDELLNDLTKDCFAKDVHSPARGAARCGQASPWRQKASRRPEWQPCGIKNSHDGVIAFSRTGDIDLGEYDDAEIIVYFGDVPTEQAFQD